MFTGSTAVGQMLAAACGERLIGCSMELGCKNAILILEDADLDRAAEIATRASFANSGQLCISMERMYVHQAIADAFLERFLERVRGMRLVPQVGWGADMGSLISQSQLDNVDGHVRDAVDKGATILAGGRPRPDLGPYFYEPTVLTDVTESMVACREETFGPVVSVYRFASEEDAIARANDTPYGLNAAIISRDTKRAAAIAARLRSGTVNINEGYAPAWGTIRSTMGGMGESGMGRRHGDEGLLKYTERQTVATQRFLGFGAPLGLRDDQWGDALTLLVKTMTRMGMK
jgi:succinate-semialdehyde dehydrogenase/glutarate-semialdehyde dehydrogenase